MRFITDVLITFFSLVSSCILAQDSAEYSLKVASRKGINHANGSNDFTAYKDYATRSLEQVKGFTPKNIKLDKYGGRMDMKMEATGFYYIAKKDNRFWAVDPDGYCVLNIGLNAVNMGNSDRNKAAFKEKYGNENTWLAATQKMIREDGFNCTGAWSNNSLIANSPLQISQPLSYTINLDFMSKYGDKRGGTFVVPGHKGYPKNTIFVFDTAFVSFCDNYAKQLTKYASDKNLFGYFSDNEMPLSMKNLDGYLSLNHADPGYIAAKQFLDNKGIDTAKITDKERAEFLYIICDKYFATVASAIKKYDPNHMYLGCRFYGNQRNIPEVITAAGKYMDVMSMNYYNVWTPLDKDMDNWMKWANKPFIITEWYVKGEDSGMPNTAGAGWIVKTQADRGLFYQNYTLKLLESKGCVGWHWFKYMDNDPLQKGAEPSNTDANKGIVNYNYDIYQPLVDKMKSLNENVYGLMDFFDKRYK